MRRLNVLPQGIKWIYVALLGVAGYLGANAQCDPPDLLPTPDCNTAPLICLQGACYSTQQNPPIDPVPDFCGPNTILNNPQYILIQAEATDIQLSIAVTACNGAGCGLQAALVDPPDMDCQAWGIPDVLDCNPGTNVGGSMNLQASGLTPGDFYLLMIDGCAGQICEWEILGAGGVFEPELPPGEDLQSAQADDPIACPGQDSWTAFAQPQVTGAAGYLWYGFPWGDETTTLPNLDIPIPDDAPPGTYQICVIAFTGCDSTDLPGQCFDITIVEIDDQVGDPITLCPEEYDAGYLWGTQTITSPGTYTQTFDNAVGCPYDSTVEFLAYPEPADGLIDTIICELPPFTYEGIDYNTAGDYELDYPGASEFGCDSIAELNLDFALVEGDITFECEFGDFVLSVEIFNQIPANVTPLYWWTDNAGTFITDEEEARVQLPGTYNLTLTIEIDGKQCDFVLDPITINLDDILPEAPVLSLADSSVCQLDLPEYFVEVGPPDVFNYNWTVPSDATILSGQGSNGIAVDWSTSSGGEVCVSMENACGVGPETCFNVEVIAQPIASFDMPLNACVNETVILDFDGSASPNAEFFWNFGGGNIVTGGTGPGPHEISWSSTGAKEVILQVVEPGCDTASVMQEIFIESLGLPVINCSSTTTSITFTWSTVPGATSYDANVLSGQTGGVPVNDTTFEITGLANGENVQLEVIVTGSGVCPPTADTVVCSAQDCTAPTATVNAITPQCANDAPQNLELLVNGTPASGTWNGPGITDQANGTFDPSVAGVGSHQVSVTYDDGSCQFNFTRTIVVNARPTATFSASGPICIEETSNIQYAGNAGAGATFTWDFDGGMIVSGADPGPYEIMWATEGLKTLTLYVEENGCVSDTLSVQVQVDPAIQPPVLQCNTSTSEINFTWANVANATQYTINLLDGQAGVQTPNNYRVSGLNPGDSVTVELVVSGNGACPPVTDTLTCYAQDCPTPVITLIPADTAFCLYQGSTGPFNFTADVVGGTGSGTWSGMGITDAATGLFDPNVVGPGSYTVTYDYIDQGCQFTEQATVTVSGPPSADIFAASTTLTCDNNNELTLEGGGSTAPNGTPVYEWKTQDGLIRTPVDSQAAIVGAPGTYTLVVSDPVSGCVDSTSIDIQQDAGVPTANAGPDQRLDCDVTSVSLGGNSSTGSSITYAWSTQFGRITSDPTMATITADLPGTYILEVSDTTNGCISTDDVVVTENTTAPTVDVVPDGILTCDVQTVNIVSTVTGGSGNYAYEWSTQNGTLQSDPDAQDAVAISPGLYQLVVTDLDNGCVDSASATVQADSDVIASLDVTITTLACFGDGDGAIVIEQVNGGSQPYTYAWSNGNATDSVAGLRPGTYSVTVTDDNGCSFQQSWTLSEPEQVTANLGSDITANLGDSVVVVLTTNVDSGALAQTTWTGLVPDCDLCLVNTFIAENSGQVGVTVIDTNGCSASSSLEVFVEQPRGVFVPNAFSPNEDGVNDLLTVYGPSIMMVNNFTIYDRWGNVVFSQAELSPGTGGWDGTMNGEAMLPGVYVYYAEIVHNDDFREEKIGDVTLVR